MKHLLIIFALFFSMLCTHALASPTFKIASVHADGTLQLDDGSVVRLAGIKLGPKGHSALAALCGDRNLLVEGTAPERHSGQWAQVYALDQSGKKTWVQKALIESGQAFVLPMTEAEDFLEPLLLAEKSARASKIGLWRDPAYVDWPADQASDRIGAYAFVVGTVTDVTRHKDKTYLNFGDDWRTDFSVVLSPRVARDLKRAALDAESLHGKKLRIRGMVERSFGPMIAPQHAEQIELLETAR